MTSSVIAHYRLHNQHIAGLTLENPADVVRWLVAVQAQDYLGSLWAIGLRTRGATERTIEQAIADRTIVRTWPMRGTLHFVAAPDVHWMLELLTPRVISNSRWRHRQLELEEAVFASSRKLLSRALRGGKQLTREGAYRVLEMSGISTANARGLHILAQLAHEGLLCFGARAGKQQTFVLLEEWLPSAKTKPREEALAELARRYFASHGPATLQDFAWWSGLTTADARIGLEANRSHLVREEINGHSYWFSSFTPPARSKRPNAYLLPAYDEYTIAYKDRSAVLDPSHAKLQESGNGFLSTVVINGQVVGTWKRTLNKTSVVITPRIFGSISKLQRRALDVAANQYGDFLQQRVVLE